MTAPWVAAFVVLAVAVLVLLVLMLGLLRRIAPILEAALSRLDQPQIDFGGLSAGVEVPPFRVWSSGGEESLFPAATASGSIMLFVSEDCGPCEHMVTELAPVDREIDGLELIVITDAPVGTDLPVGPGVRVFHQKDQEASIAFQNSATPQAFSISSAGVVLDRLIPGSLRDLHRLAEGREGAQGALENAP